ncbi:hypothetical protein JTE90_019946 [Oedothorax gibbosus]|uniref:DEK-C domain-containing protein n=1 Tax=Oedothorax gibbosus TaxID=931172 RepID=A0AAV6USR0_9ARAC|nr:hypothetical protein JTE90_019946 [Oedothorax gibbosus]
MNYEGNFGYLGFQGINGYQTFIPNCARADNRRLLKQTAVPSIFSHRPPLKSRNPSKHVLPEDSVDFPINNIEAVETFTAMSTKTELDEVAEMDIEIDENTEANSADKSDEAPLKENADSLTEKESAGSPEEDGNDTNVKETVDDNNSEEIDQESSHEVPNEAKKLRGRPQKNLDKETDKSNSNEEKDPESSNEVPDQAKKLRGRPKKNQDKKGTDQSDDNEGKVSESSNEVIDQTKKLRGRPKKNQDEGETVQSDDNGEKDPESSNEVPDDSKKSRGRPKKNLIMESESNKKDTRQSKDDSKEKFVDSESRQSRARTSTLKSKLGEPEVTSSLKRSNKSAISSPEEEGEVPQKKLRSSSKDNTPKKSANLSPDTTEADSTTRKNLRARPIKPVPPVLKAWNLDPLRISNLNSFPVIKKRVQKAELRFIRSLHQVLYNKELAKDAPGKQLRKEILDFQGFSFKKASTEFKKHKNLFEKMPHSTISHISNILDMKDKDIFKIMEFLLQPSKIIYCEVDPLHPSMQPELKLQKISLENFPEDASSDDDSYCEIFSSSEDTVVTGKRKRFPSSKLRFYESEFELPASKKESKEPERYSSITIKPRKGLVPIAPKKVYPQVQSAKKTSVQKTKQTITPAKTPQVDRKMKIVKRPISNDINVRRKALELALQIQGEVEPSALEAGTNEESSLDSLEYETDIKQEMVTDEESEEKEHAKPKEENSSEGTLSADEETPQGTQRVKRLYKTPAIPLRTYPTIKENVLKADVGSLRRLHILLFGASDKESNLGGNILSFGGFPFYKGSQEWKRKEFLLSLLSKNTLKEYLDILDIKYPEGNNSVLIKKLMNFLVVSMEKSPVDIDEDDNEADSDMEIVTTDELVPLESEELSGKLPVIKNIKFLKNKHEALKKKPEVKKKPVKKPENPNTKKRRKVLMDEAQVRRLEADLAREQRILEREKKLHEQQVKKLDPSIKYNPAKAAFEIPKRQVLKVGTASQADEEMLNALMETVYQRRELKKAGAKVSVPNKGGHTRLGELANVKFLVVTANYNDLDVLHHLIYMTEAVKGRVRKNILDFAGFNFTEESPAYQDRMNFLRSLGYDISRRIAFLLGLCPFKTLIAQQDLNELIMYFLMSPCQASQVPIRDLPTTFFGNEMPVELSALVKKHSSEVPVTPTAQLPIQPTVSKSQPGQSQRTSGQKAKKSFRSSFVSSKMQNLQPSISTLPLKAPEKLLQPTTFPQKQSQVIKTLNIPTGQAQEIFIQQQTTDGQQKTFKLVKLPDDHPLMASIKNQTQQQVATTPPQPIAITPPVIGAPPGLPPGLIVFKNNPTNPALSSVMQTVPLGIGQSAITSVVPKTTRMLLPKLDDNGPVITSVEGGAEGVLTKEKDSDVSVEGEYGTDEPDELNPLDEEEGPPTDDDIYGAIQDIIHSCPSLEDITLRNVITRVSAKYPNYDLSPQHYFMKECVKKTDFFPLRLSSMETALFAPCLIFSSSTTRLSVSTLVITTYVLTNYY